MKQEPKISYHIAWMLSHWVVQVRCSDGVGLYSAEIFKSPTEHECIQWLEEHREAA